MNSYFVPDRFRAEVELHLVRNLISNPAPSTPLLLGLHGPTGVGKSFQLESVLREIGVAVTAIGTADLESDHANDPAKLVRKTYLNAASQMDDANAVVSAVVINDIDTALGDWGDFVQYTVNRQLVIGEIMNLCDRPTSLTSRPNSRVPIFLTANDLTKLYGPLVRPGRMKLFHWVPNPTELADMMAAAIPQLKPGEIPRIIEEFPGRTISFFTDALNDVRDNHIRATLARDGIRATLSRAKRGALDSGSAVSAPELISAAKILVDDETAIRNYSKSRSEDI